MSDADDPLVSTLGHLFEGQEGNTKLLAEYGRDLARIAAALEELAKLPKSVDLLTGQLRSALHERLTPLEGRVGEIEQRLTEQANGSG